MGMGLSSESSALRDVFFTPCPELPASSTHRFPSPRPSLGKDLRPSLPPSPDSLLCGQLRKSRSGSSFQGTSKTQRGLQAAPELAPLCLLTLEEEQERERKVFCHFLLVHPVTRSGHSTGQQHAEVEYFLPECQRSWDSCATYPWALFTDLVVHTDPVFHTQDMGSTYRPRDLYTGPRF